MTKLDQLRSLFQKYKVNALLIPSTDPHQSEYPAYHWKDREFISGFTGSAGLVVITEDKAALWTDSRYFLQAEQELLGSGITLQKLKNQFAPEHIDWILANLKTGDTLTLDGWDISINQLRNLENLLSKAGIKIRTDIDLISEIWPDRPPLSIDKIMVHNIAYSGKSTKEKISELRHIMSQAKVDFLLVTALDEIAWLLNIRGKDVMYNPVVVGYVIVSTDKVFFFVNNEKIDPSTANHFQESEITILDYKAIVGYLKNISSSHKLQLDANDCNSFLYNALNCSIIENDSIIRQLKAVKNEVELNNIRQAMIIDGVALTHAHFRLEKILEHNTITEAAFSDIIQEEHSNQEGYMGESFAAIIGYNANGAIIHYHPTHQKCSTIKKEGVLLCDCGAQYKNGTTDITRTIALSKPNDDIKKHFTLVLKGNIALTMATFIEGTCGAQIDILARQFLWQNGLNYLHGTGHGVGAFLNVHEGPQGIAGVNTDRGRTPLKQGMILSNEPGYYLEGQYGIRIENLILTQKHPDHEGYLCFEVLSWFPIDFDLIDPSMLDSREKAWLNKYHQNVYDKISPFLQDKNIKDWFKFKCRGFN